MIIQHWEKKKRNRSDRRTAPSFLSFESIQQNERNRRKLCTRQVNSFSSCSSYSNDLDSSSHYTCIFVLLPFSLLLSITCELDGEFSSSLVRFSPDDDYAGSRNVKQNVNEKSRCCLSLLVEVLALESVELVIFFLTLFL